MSGDKRVFASFVASFERDGLSNSPPATIYGLDVFVTRFIRNLLRYGDYDEFHFFCRGPAAPLQEGELLASDPRIRLRRLHEFGSAADETGYAILHNPWTPDIGPWTELRNRVCAQSVPVTGMTHTVSYHSFLPRVLATMMLGPRAFDSIVCSSECGRTVMRNWISHLCLEFGEQMGRPITFDGRLDMIPIGIDSEEFIPRDHAPLRQRLALPQDRTLLLYLGRFSAYDKMDLAPLLLAFKLASRAQCDRQLFLVLAGSAGRFDYAGELSQLVRDMQLADSVEIRTNVPAADIPSLYAAADIFVSPSDNVQETFGQSLIEAMASGLPVVCSDWNGYREIVVEGETGFLIPTYWVECGRQISDYAGMSEWLTDHFLLAQSVSVDVRHMAAAIASLGASPERRADLGERGRRRAIAHYDWRVVIRRYVDLWNELGRIASREASSSRQARQGSWYRPDLFGVFRHYCTTVLSDAATVRLNDDATVPPAPLTAAQSQLLRTALLQSIARHAVTDISIADLQKRVVASTACSADDFRLHLLWLSKYDAITLTPR